MGNTSQIDAIKAGMERKTTNQLLDIIQFTQDDYTPVAIEVIIVVLKERGVPDSEVEIANENYLNAKSRMTPGQFVPKEKGLNKWILWLMYIIALTILLGLIKEIQKGTLNTWIGNSQENPNEKSWWNDNTRTKVKKTLMQRDDIKTFSIEAREVLCDCIANKLEQKYPDGLTNIFIPDSATSRSIGEACLKELNKKQ